MSKSSLESKSDAELNANALVLKNLWLNTFISDFEEVFRSIEIIEGKKLPFSINYLSTLVVEDLLSRNEDLKKWADIFGNKLKGNTQKTIIENKKMDIVFVTGVFPGISHGGGLRVFDIIHELSLNGHQIHLYTSNTIFEPGEATEFLASLCKTLHIVEPQEFNLTSFENWLEINNHYFDIGYYVWPWAINLFPKNKNRIKKIAFEFIECTTRRLWMDLQSFTTDTNSDKITSTLYDLLNHYYCEVMAAKEADILISVTEKDAQFIKHIYLDSDAKVIPTGLSRFEFEKITQKIPTTSHPSACFIGNYIHYPNLDGLIWYLNYVHGKILESVPDYKFSILGKGNEEAIDELKSEYKHFADSLNWLGGFDKVALAVSPHTICLCPLISGAGLRGKIIQFSALKKATVSTSIGVCGTPFAHDKSIMVSDDPAEFAKYTVQLLQDEFYRNEIAENAFLIVENEFSWSSSIASLEYLFQEATK